MFPAILGGLAASAGGSLIGGALGGGAPAYEPSKTMEDLSEYGRNQLRATKPQKQAIRAEAKTYSSPGAKEAFLQSYLDRFSNPEFIQKQLKRSYKKPIDYQTGGYRELASRAYELQGLEMPEQDFERYMNIAKATNVRSPEAFSDFVRQDLIASDKVRTPFDIAWEQQYGAIRRGPDGSLTQGRGMVTFDPERFKRMASDLKGVLSSNINISSSMSSI
jgi:hypothetical protein